MSYSLNDYDVSGNLVKISELSPADELTSYKTYAYSNGLLATAVSFTGHSNERIREEKYVYDKNKNLVIMQSVVKALWISSTSYELHYEYFSNGQ